MISNTEKTFKGLSAQTLVTILRGIFELVFFSFMSRLLGKDEFGYYALLTTIVTIFKAFSEAGIGASVIHKSNQNKQYVDTAFVLSIILGVFIACLGVLFCEPISLFLCGDDYIIVPLRCVMYILPLYGINSVLRAILIKQLQFLKYGLAQLTSYIIASIIGVYLAYKGYGIYALVVLTMVDSVLLNLILFPLSKYRPNYKLCSFFEVKSIVAYGGWLTLENLFRNLYHQLDSLVLARLVPVATIGAFNRPRSFVNSISTNVNGIFDVTLFPILSSIKENDGKIKSAFKKSTSLLNISSSLIVVFFITNARLIVTIFFGEQWIELVPIFQILGIDFLFKANGRLSDCFFRSLGFVKVNFIFRVLACVVLTGAIILGSRWGLVGIATMVIICDSVVALSKYIYLSTMIRMPLKELLKRLIVSYRASVVIALLSIPLLCLIDNFGIVTQICVLIVQIILVGLIFICMPRLVGEEYKRSVYPILRKFSFVNERNSKD